MQRDGGVGPSSSRVPEGGGGGRGAAELRTYRDWRKPLWPPREDQDLLCLVLTFGGRWAPALVGRGDNNTAPNIGARGAVVNRPARLQ